MRVALAVRAADEWVIRQELRAAAAGGAQVRHELRKAVCRGVRASSSCIGAHDNRLQQRLGSTVRGQHRRQLVELPVGLLVGSKR